MAKFLYCRESKVIQNHRLFLFGALFGGKLMTIIDDASSISITRHCRRGAVTASIDQMNFLKPLKSNHSVCVDSYVSGAHHKSYEKRRQQRLAEREGYKNFVANLSTGFPW